jgi:hypothetical protein
MNSLAQPRINQTSIANKASIANERPKCLPDIVADD